MEPDRMTADPRSSHSYSAPRSFIESMVALAIVLAIWLFFLWNAWSGIDFGYHWDEPVTTISVRETVETGVILPQIYLYPGMCYDLALLALLPEALHELRTGETPWQKARADVTGKTISSESGRSRFDMIQESLRAYVDQPEYLLTVRKLFAFISSLLIIWVFATGWVSTGSPWCGLFAASLAGLSWEYIYHSRWAVPDAITTSFAALTLFCCALIIKYPARQSFYRIAAIAAGLCASSKYPGAIVMLSVSLAIVQSEEVIGVKLWKRLAAAWGWFLTVFLVTSPGTVLNPLRFFDGLQFNKQVYSTGHPGHTIEAGWTHFTAILDYLTRSLPSQSALLSIAVAILVFIGILQAFNMHKKLFWLTSIPLVTYILYMGSHHVFVVRNSLLLCPFWISLATVGAWTIWQVTRFRLPMRVILIGFVTVLVFANSNSQMKATTSIINRISDRPQRVVALLDWAQTHKTTIALSPRILSELNACGLTAPQNLVTNPIEAQTIAAYLLEVNETWPLWYAHDRELTLASFGPSEVNVNYYPFWAGEDRIIVIKSNTAQACGISIESDRYGPWPLYEL
jgi:hypothetical protein